MSLAIALYVVAALEVVGTLFAIANVGKPRKPHTPGDTTFLVVIAAIIVTVLVMAAMRL